MSDFGDEERDDFAHQGGVQQYRQRRSPPRLPAGTLRIHGDAPGGCMPVVAADFLTEREKAIFRLMNGEVLNVIRFGVEDNCPVPDDYREALQRAARALFGYEPDDALWLEPLLVELELGRSERLALETRAADPSNTNLLALAEAVLERTRRGVQRLAPSVALPAWLSPRLTSLLLKRFSFSGGGGAKGALAKESIRQMLAEPCQLSQYLRDDPARLEAFEAELNALDEVLSTPKASEIAKKRPRTVIDAEHATARERREARQAARECRPRLARVGSQRIILLESGFVGVSF